MKDDAKQLDALTNQRVEFTLGGNHYTARRANLNDIGLINRYRREKEKAGDDANIDLDASLYILSELMKPNYTLTPEQLGAQIDLTQYKDMLVVIEELGAILGSLGLRVPQIAKTTNR